VHHRHRYRLLTLAHVPAGIAGDDVGGDITWMGEPPRLSVVPLSMPESSSRPPLLTLMPLAVAPRAPKWRRWFDGSALTSSANNPKWGVRAQIGCIWVWRPKSSKVLEWRKTMSLGTILIIILIIFLLGGFSGRFGGYGYGYGHGGIGVIGIIIIVLLVLVLLGRIWW
jgi:hypothetical protein